MEWFDGTELVRGPWDVGSCHAGPPAGLMARAAEALFDNHRLVRLTISLDRPIPIDGFRIEADLERQGRKVASSRVVLIDGDDRVCARAAGLHLAPSASSVPIPTAEMTTPDLADATPGPFPITRTLHGRTGFTASAETRYPPDHGPGPGPTMVWMKTLPLLDDEVPSPFQRICPLADCGNATSRNAEPDQVSFINPDLTIILHREPVGEWLGSDAISHWGQDGIGLADALLFDAEGPVGRASQTLLVHPVVADDVPPEPTDGPIIETGGEAADAAEEAGSAGRQIACGHCGGHHGSVAEVRSCSAEHPEQLSLTEFGPEPKPPSPTVDGATAAGSPPAPGPLAGSGLTAEELAGPDWAGRSLLIAPGAPVPEPWADAPRLEVDATKGPVEDPTTVAALRTAWRGRQRLVIVWDGPPPNPNPAHPIPFEEWGPDINLPGEAAAFFATANAVVASPGQPGPPSVDDTPSFAPLSMALAAGARLADGEGDVTTPGGITAWVDGGPLDLGLDVPDGQALLPRVNLITGSLQTLHTEPDCRADLAPDQLAAVTHHSGPARILAPAGSGKTRVLTERTRHLVGDAGLEARTVSLVAYNRRARMEMRERLSDVWGLDIRTLNSLALALANGTGPFAGSGPSPRSARTIDEFEARRLLEDLVPGRRRRQLTDPLEPWVDALSACRLGLRHPEEVEAAFGGDVAGFTEVFGRYRATLADRNLVDFDEQILAAIDRLLTDPEARAAARRAAPVLLIDEFQDLTPAHLLLVRLVAGPACEVFAVGDDDQTIYGYAGASPRWLVDFDQFFPDASDHHLTVNYRCPADVVEAAVSLLSHNQHRVTKSISARPDATKGLAVLSGDPQEALVDRVRSLIDHGAQPADIAVLTRVHAALMPAAVHLTVAGFPVTRPAGLDRRVLERSGVAAALAWLRLATAPERALDGDDIRLALRRPPRSVHPRVVDWACEQGSVSQLEALADRLNTEKEALAIAGLADDIKRLRDLVEGAESPTKGGGTTAEVLAMIYDDIGLLGAASQLDRSQRTARRAAHADELAALTSVAELQPDPGRFEAWLRSTLEAIPTTTAGSDDQTPTGAHDGGAPITLATVHTTKGLEWPHVVVHDVRGNLFPHGLATDIEEERRVFHVAVTRGRDTVSITPSGPPSPFVAQLSEPRAADEPWPTASTGDEATKAGAVGRKRTGSKPAVAPVDGPEPSAPHRDALVAWRRERCGRDGVPAYVVLNNKTLDAIAATLPSDLGELGQISGIGPARLERYGADILGVLASVD